MPQNKDVPEVHRTNHHASNSENNAQVASPNAEEGQLIVPPSLLSKIVQFEAHYNLARASMEKPGGKFTPIMLVGPTGVGKSLFYQICKSLFREEHANEEGDPETNHPIEEANCAHFGGEHSDPNIARSELFGLNPALLDPGILLRTGRRPEEIRMPGLIERADNGMLFLEEIGDLPPAVQAMLLTFIETGRYRGLGIVLTEEVETRIIGATNREEKLRDDLRHRFFPFYIPALHKRRGDILYYLYDEFPDLVKSLRRWEVLLLLSYNWPGNVREVERVGRLLMRKSELTRYLPFEDKAWKEEGWKINKKLFKDPLRFFSLEMQETQLTPRYIASLYEDLDKKGINLKTLEFVLNQYRVGLSGNELAFPELSNSKGEAKMKIGFPEYGRRFQVKAFSPFQPFDEAFKGYALFCSLFCRDPFADKNSLNIQDLKGGLSMEFHIHLSGRGVTLPAKVINAIRKMMDSVFSYISGSELQRGEHVPEAYAEREAFFKTLAERYPSSKFLNALTGRKGVSKKEADYLSMKNDDLLRLYYEKAVASAGGVLKRAAERIDMDYQKFLRRLDELGIREKRRRNQ